uniref:Uncharacterized protein n=1 Tax=Arundo donax TaxID=35708 RepID=A0A0A8YP25_ARUDO
MRMTGIKSRLVFQLWMHVC